MIVRITKRELVEMPQSRLAALKIGAFDLAGYPQLRGWTKSWTEIDGTMCFNVPDKEKPLLNEYTGELMFFVFIAILAIIQVLLSEPTVEIPLVSGMECGKLLYRPMMFGEDTRPNLAIRKKNKSIVELQPGTVVCVKKGGIK